MFAVDSRNNRLRNTREFKLEAVRPMADHGVICSMSRSGNVWNNAAMESFFSSLKTERTARKMYRTRDDEARADVFDCIDASIIPSAGTFRSAI
jgi:transposase InsO family protein